MEGTPQTLKKHCPACGQRLAIIVRTLDRKVQCPRCQTEHVVGMFIDRNETLHAVEPPLAAAAPPPVAGPPPPPATEAVYESVPSSAERPPPAPNDTAHEQASPPFAPAPFNGPFPSNSPPLATAPQVAPIPPLATGPFPPKPPSPTTGPGFATSGMRVAEAGVAAAKASTSLLLTIADRADALLSGRRLLALGLTAIAGVLAHYLSDGSASATEWAWAANASFVIVAALVLLAFVARCREDGSGPFSWRLAGEQVGTLGSVASEAMTDLVAAPWGLRFQHLGAAVAFVGVVISEALIVMGDLTGDRAGGARPLVALWVAALGLVIAWWGRTQEAALHDVLARAPAEAPRPPEASANVPLLVDTGAPMSGTAMPLVDEVLGVLGAWRPGRQGYESAYHVRLHGALRRKLAGVKVESEARRRDRYGKDRRVDLILSREGESLLIEVKASTATGALDRATTQVWDYAALGLGPVLVVLCGASPAEPTVRRLVDHVGEQRTLGLRIGVVVAAVRGAPAVLAGGAAPPRSPMTLSPQPLSSGRGLPHLTVAAAVSLFFAWEVAHVPATQPPTSSQAPAPSLPAGPIAPAALAPVPAVQAPPAQAPPPPGDLPCETAFSCLDCAARRPCGWCGAWGRCVRLVSDPTNCNGAEARACGTGWACNPPECPTGR